jgi:hypothetical protein
VLSSALVLTRVIILPLASTVPWTVSLAAQEQASAAGQVRRLGGNIRANAVEGPLPRLADRKPDLSGVWDLGTMRVEMTVNDPGAYSRPFTLSGVARLMPKEDELIEYVCNENNQDIHYLVGPRL